MNRNTVAAFLVAAGASVAGGFALVSSFLSPAGAYVADCNPGADCVLVTSPRADQCAVLLEGGGDRPGEVSGLDGSGAEAARMLASIIEAQLISGAYTFPSVNGCEVAILMSSEQATAWRDALTGQRDGGPSLGDVAAVLRPSTTRNVPIQWGGWSTPEQRTEAFSLSPVSDGGTP